MDLPKGHSALLRDPEDVTERRRRAYVSASEAVFAGLLEAGIDPDEFDVVQDALGQDADATKIDKGVLMRLGTAAARAGMAELQRLVDDHLAAAFVESWSFESPISAEAMLDIPSKARAILVARCKSLAPQLTPEFDPNPDEDSPTTPSSV